MIRKIFAVAALCFFASLGVAHAQSSPVVVTGGCGTAKYSSNPPYFTVDTTGKLCVNATVNASVGGFVPSLGYTTLTATAASSASTALPTNTGTVAFQNQTSAPVSCTLASGAATATTNELIVPAGSTIFVGTTGYDHAACINQTGSASNVIILAGGTGLGTGFGGGSSGGGGGAVTIADGADVTEGAKADAAWVSGSGSVVSILKNIAGGVAGAIPAGTAAIGTVSLTPNVTPTDCSSTITSGGTAQAAIAAQTTLHGFTIANIDTGHGAEPLWISFTTTAAALTAASYPLPAPTATTFVGMGSYTTPPGFGTNHAVSIVGATTGHVYSCSWW